MACPNFIIIGAMKAGTTSLHRYLDYHPDIYMSTPKEINYFCFHLNRGKEWYESHFPSGKICGESSPNYSKWAVTPEAIKAYNHKLKLIYILRNPVDRFISECNHVQVDPIEILTEVRDNVFSTPINKQIFRNGLYGFHLRNFLSYFPKDQIHICLFEDLKNEPKKVLASIFEFIGVEHEKYSWESIELKPHHVTKDKINLKKSVNHPVVKFLRRAIKWRWLVDSLKPFFFKRKRILVMSDQAKQELKTFYANDIRQLKLIIGNKSVEWIK